MIFPSGIFIFARILLFFFLYLKMRFQGKYLRILLSIRSGDIETNPATKKQPCLKSFHWNLNGLTAHDFIKLRLRGCSYGGELAWLGGLARLGEISPSFRNSYENITCSYEK